MEAQDEDNVLTAEEYDVQYFGFSPQSFMNGMYNAIQVYLHEGISALNDTILNMFSGKVSEIELKEVTSKQGQEAVRRLDAHFEKAEWYLSSNVFNVPAHVLLPEDRLQVEKPCTEEQMAELDSKILEVTDKIVAVKYANTQIRERMSKVETLQQQFDETLTRVNATYNEVSSQSRSFQTTVENLSYINELLESVHI